MKLVHHLLSIINLESPKEFSTYANSWKRSLKKNLVCAYGETDAGPHDPFIIYFPVRVSHSWVGCFHGFGPKAELGE